MDGRRRTAGPGGSVARQAGPARRRSSPPSTCATRGSTRCAPRPRARLRRRPPRAARRARRRTAPSATPSRRSTRTGSPSSTRVEQRLCFGRLDLVGRRDPLRRAHRADRRRAHVRCSPTGARPPRRPSTGRPPPSPTASSAAGTWSPAGATVTGRRGRGARPRGLRAEVGGPRRRLSGEGALLAALAAGRTGRMGDIVATIQAEQDAVIRADLPARSSSRAARAPARRRSRCTAPPTCSTRTAARSSAPACCCSGPSRTFLRYIDQVLPSLGETGVVTATVADLVPRRGADGAEPDDGRGDQGPRRHGRRSSRGRSGSGSGSRPSRSRSASTGARVRDPARATSPTPIARARRSGRPHNLARVVFVRDMLAQARRRSTSRSARPRRPAEDRAEVIEELRTTREVRIALNLAWMPLTPQQPRRGPPRPAGRLGGRGPGAHRRRARGAAARAAGAPWTAADVPLLDEAAELLGEDDQAERAQAAEDARRRARPSSTTPGRCSRRPAPAAAWSAPRCSPDRFAHGGPRLTTAERAAADRTWTYGHVVVDEAQELSAMAWRMLLRRCPTRSMTIVGDVAQTAAPAGRARLGPRARPGAARLVAARRAHGQLPHAGRGRRRRPARRARRRPAREPLTSARDVPDALRVQRSTSPRRRVVDEVGRARRRLGRTSTPTTASADGSR